MEKTDRVKIHPLLEEKFSFDEKLLEVPMKKGFTEEEKQAYRFRNALVKKKRYIYPICKLYYDKYKSILSTIPNSKMRENLYDFLRVVVQRDRNGKMFYLEDLYNRKTIIPDTFSILSSLFEEVDLFLFSSISQFIEEKKQKELQSFNVITQFIGTIHNSCNSLNPFYDIPREEILNVLSKASFENGDYYFQLLNKKVMNPKMRLTLFSQFYRMEIPFSASELTFFLNACHFDQKRLTSILVSYGITRTQFYNVFAMSLCIDPSLKEVYATCLEKVNKTEEEVSFYPSLDKLKYMEEKLIEKKIIKEKVYS